MMCGKALRGRQRRWCGDKKCFQLYALRKGDSAALRAYVWERDGGKCSRCGLDIKTLLELRGILLWPDGHFPYNEKMASMMPRRRWNVLICDGWSEKEWRNLLRRIGVKFGYLGHLWEADHIVPLSEGGEHHEANMRILCLKCHKDSTRKLLKRLARSRRSF